MCDRYASAAEVHLSRFESRLPFSHVVLRAFREHAQEALNIGILPLHVWSCACACSGASGSQIMVFKAF